MMRRILARLPLAVWLVNVLLAVLSYFLNMMWAGLPLFAVMFAQWGLVVKVLKKRKRAGETLLPKKAPAWAIAAAALSVGYTLVNFILCAVQLREGGPMFVDGVYCLWNHGLIRQISLAEYQRLQGVEGRLFTGHMLAFTGLSLLVLQGRAEKLGRSGAEGREEG